MPTYEEILRIPDRLDERRVLLFDGHSHVYRAFYGIPDLMTRAGLPVNAVYGFWRILLRTLRDYPSAYVTVVFDAAGDTFRHELYPEYKANRKPMPEELAAQFPLIERLLAALGIPTISVPGVEADDVLASISLQAAERKLTCLIATSDKDMAQVVSDRVHLLRPGGRGVDTAQQILDPAGVEAKYGVPPEQIVDLLALIGDTSDNVPGVPGVGDKTAVRLIRQFGSLDAALDSADAVRNRRVASGLENHRADAELARRLICLRSDVELDEIPTACRLRGIDYHRGPAADVAARFREVVERYRFDAFVRVSADSPLLDQRLVDRAREIFHEGDFEIVTNIRERSFPRGQSVEVLGAETFREGCRRMRRPEEREHVTAFFYRNRTEFKIFNLSSAGFG